MATSQRQRIRMNNSPKRERGVAIADALWAALNEEVQGADGRPTRRLRVIARRLVERAQEGDIRAVEVLFDRLAGRPMQAIEAEVGLTLEDLLLRLPATNGDHGTARAEHHA